MPLLEPFQPASLQAFASAVFTRLSMDSELLIREIESRTAIWDRRDPKHCSREYMSKVWKEVASTLELEGQ